MRLCWSCVESVGQFVSSREIRVHCLRVYDIMWMVVINALSVWRMAAVTVFGGTSCPRPRHFTLPFVLRCRAPHALSRSRTLLIDDLNCLIQEMHGDRSSQMKLIPLFFIGRSITELSVRSNFRHFAWINHKGTSSCPWCLSKYDSWQHHLKKNLIRVVMEGRWVNMSEHRDYFGETFCHIQLFASFHFWLIKTFPNILRLY